VLRWLLPHSIRGEAILGDLREEYVERAAPLRWYARTAMGIAVHAVRARLGRGRHLDPEGPGTRPPRARRRNPMDSFFQDVRYAVRTMLRAPGSTAVIVATLAVAIGANTAVFSLINGVLLRPLPVANENRVVKVYTSDFSSGLYGTSSFPDFLDFREQVDALEALAAYTPAVFSLATPSVAERLPGLLVSGDYFSLLGLQPAAGRLLGPSDVTSIGADPVAVLGYAAWQRQFGGDPAIVGSRITLSGAPFTVIGVAPRGFTGLDLGFTPDVWVPVTMFDVAVPGRSGARILDSRGSRWWLMVGLLGEGATMAQLSRQLTTVMARLAEAYPRSNLGTLQQPERPRPVTALPVGEAAVGGGEYDHVSMRAALLLGIVGIVLLIACANVANLLIARAQRRQQEIAVRLALGAGRGRLVRQMLIESSVLAAVSGAAGLALAAVLSRALLSLGLPSILQGSLTMDRVPLDGRVLAFTACLSLLTGLAFGLVPALRASRADVVPALKEGGVAGIRRRWGRWGLREALVVGQVALSILLLTIAGAFVLDTVAAYRTDLGFNPEGVAMVRLAASREGLSAEDGAALYDRILERLQALPEVQRAALSGVVPVQASGPRRGYRIPGFDTPGAVASGVEVSQFGNVELNFNVVSEGYFETLEIPLLRGRLFTTADGPGTRPVAVINQAMADVFWPGQPAVGQRILRGQEDSIGVEIVGVVATGKYRNVREDPLPYLYLPASQSYQSSVAITVRGRGPVGPLFTAIRSVVHELRPSMPVFGARSLKDHFGVAMAQDRTTATMTSVLGALALLVAAVGLFGVLAYAVARRTRELGIRSALGADAAALMRMILRYGMILALVGAVLGGLLALGAGSAIGRILPETNSTSLTMLGGAVAVLLAVSAAASFVPALRATRVDPVTALREE